MILIIYFIEKQLMYNIIYVIDVQHRDSQFLRLYYMYSYYKMLTIFPVLYNISL